MSNNIKVSGLLGTLLLVLFSIGWADEKDVVAGSFQPTDESLKQYKCPDWFRDAKLGIWAVWGPESVPMQGDWYARKLYEEGGRQYKYHVEHYGHPSKFGFKDIIPLWKAEKWEPDRLMELYKKAGAKYFCMIAEHHDNFDCWNSKFNRWNSINMGPKRDIAGEWKQAAVKQGLRFGMTEHLAASWWFYSAAKGADTNGPMKGIHYDGADPKYADLYWTENEKPKEHYYCPSAPTHVKEAWFNRIKDMIDRYHPDLLYSDSPLPYPDEFGRKLLTHYYNDNMQQHGGRNDAIYNCKQDSQGRWVQDLERGVMEGINPHPWQTDTCVGGWYYDEKVLERHGYKTPATVIHMLCDIVSKNGNLLLNFPPRPDGTLDEDELKILEAMAAWISVNGEAIYGTRPWKVYGEGPSKAQKGGHFNEGRLKYTACDFRFTTKDGALYAIALGWPEAGKLVVKSLASAAGKISGVTLLGCSGKLDWQQTGDGLIVNLPAQKPCDLAYAFKISAGDLQPVPVVVDTSILPGADGRIVLPSAEAAIHGESPKYENGGGKDQIGHWANAEDFVSWNFKATNPGTFALEIKYSCAAPGSEFTVEIGDQKLTGKSTSTGSWSDYRTDNLGTMKLDKPGNSTLAVKPKAEPKWKVIGLKSVVLVPEKLTSAAGAMVPAQPFMEPPPAQPVPAKIEIVDGPFKPTDESLKQYKCPDWFRDAKLGIWAILGPESLPESGDWNARNMYIEGHAQYKFHVEHFGHPSKFGYKDLAAMWRADKFDPDRLMALYKKAGAKYFAVLANHHDNWDNWNSKYHRWNSVNLGPKKDIVGLWAQAARKEGLRFGVTEHLARSYSWFNTNKGSDKKGPFAGVPYDGNDPRYQDLYFPPHDDTSYAYPKNPPEWYTRQWYWRMRDLLDTYQPDLMYSDGAIPFGEVGRSLFAHFYNSNMARHGGKLEAVYNIKDMSPRTDHGDYVEGAGVQDCERGGLKGIKAEPWQTDTCIGDWFYKSGLHYKPPQMVIAMLADIVSKNGNLLLNIPLKYDGSIDAEEEKVLEGMAAWIAVNGEAIYGSRPWAVFGEGPNSTSGGHFKEAQFARMSAGDIRFTTKGEDLYAIALGWPEDGKLTVRSLGADAGKVTAVSLLGHDGKLDWSQTGDGLVVSLPEKKPCELAWTLKIAGRDLKPCSQKR